MRTVRNGDGDAKLNWIVV